MKKILIDLGSSSVKAYEYYNELTLIDIKTIQFKQNFVASEQRNNIAYKELIEFVNNIKTSYPAHLVKIYATAFFRKLESKDLEILIDNFFEDTGLYFNVISHDLENFYMQQALVGKYTNRSLIINIGGGSTELSIVENNTVIEQYNINVGVGEMLAKYPEINEQYSKISLVNLVNSVKEELPAIKNNVETAFYSGGELNYMLLADYKLTENILFKDSDHPKQISLVDFAEKNKEIFEQIRLSDLEKLMPNNPKWMHGARICSAIAQAICEKYKINNIIPSDSNLINGVVRKEYRTVTLSGSFRKHLDYILQVKDMLEKNRVVVLSPRFDKPKNPGEEFVVFNGEENMTPLQLEKHHLNSIKQSDVLIVCNKDGYVGASAQIEIGYAFYAGKRIVYTEKPEEFMLNTLPHEVGI